MLVLAKGLAIFLSVKCECEKHFIIYNFGNLNRKWIALGHKFCWKICDFLV